MKKTLLLIIAALITAWSAMAINVPPRNGANVEEGDVTYHADDLINILITGTGDDDYTKLHKTGTITPGGATLNIFPCYTPTPGDRFVIFKAPTIDGEFSNPPLIDAGGNFFVLSYEKENGDDLVVLTAVAKIFGLDIITSGATSSKPDYNYTLTVAVNPPGGGNVVPTQASFKVCDVIDIQATDNLGYAFTHWSEEGGTIIANTASPTTTAIMPARDVTITAHFECMLPEAPTANDVRVCYDGTEHSAGATPPLYSSIVWYEDATGTVTTTAPTGTASGTYKAWAASKHDSSGCESDTRTEVTLTINTLPAMNCPDDYDVCVDAPAFALSGASPVGGTYNGPGVSGSQFDPADAGVGTHTIVYTYSDDNNCTASCVFTITVYPNITITHDAGSGGTTQEVCINIAIAEIKYNTIGASGANVTGLPDGVTGNLNTNVFTISGESTVAGTFNYEIELTGVCRTVTETGTITVNENNIINHTSAGGTDTQTVCINTPIGTVTYTTTGATGADVTGLPAGVTGNWVSNVVTISGTPSVAGTYNYTVTMTGGCGNGTATGTITVNPLPGAPTAQAATGVIINSFTANWLAIHGALDYTLDVALDDAFSNFVEGYENKNVGNVTNHIVDGLNPGTTYYYRVRAINACGPGGYSNIVSVNTCPENITFTYHGASVTYGVIVRGGLCWMDRNLGAARVPTSSTDSQGYGDLFQWGRLVDGHQDRTSGTTSTLSSTDAPGHGNFITVISTPWDWRSPQNNKLWQGEDVINNPCPSGWRVPTRAELEAELLSWGTDNKNSAGAYASTLKWPVGGGRGSSGELYGVGSHGLVWSSSFTTYYAIFLSFESGNAQMPSAYRAYGLSVRCVRN